MNKYLTDLNIQNENSVDNHILKNIKRNSTVLEFGPAEGRMTKYLKEVLGCKVYIVEIESNDFLNAIKYAEDGLCSDIMEFEWTQKFSHIEFDYIIFADVLEHIISPTKVLCEAKKILKSDGKIVVSIPNIAHSAIIINLINNRFGYNKTGLLDDTHIKFFTYYSIMDMFEHCELVPILEDATYIHPKMSEFNVEYSEAEIYQDLIKGKEYGSVYQFVFQVVKKEYYESNKQLINPTKQIKNCFTGRMLNLYLDYGNGFSEEHRILKKLYYGGENKFISTEFVIPEGVKNVRLDAVEGVGCVMENLVISSEHEILSYINLNGETLNELEIFSNKDPQILIELNDKKINKIKLSLNIYMYGENEFKILKYLSSVAYIKKENIDFKKNYEHLQNEYFKLENERVRLLEEIVRRGDNLNIQNKNHDEEKMKLTKNIEENYKSIEEKDRVIEEKDRVIEEKSSAIKEKDSIIEEKSAELIKKCEIEDRARNFRVLGLTPYKFIENHIKKDM